MSGRASSVGNILFGVNIASVVAAAVNAAGGLLPATFIKSTPGTRTPGSITGGTNPTMTSYPCQGICSSFDNNEVGAQLPGGEMVKNSDRKVVLIAQTIPVEPAPGDRVTIESRTYAVVGLFARDPAIATYTVVARG